MKKTTAIQFSGGKDSLAVLHLSREMLDKCVVYFGNTGVVYPHMVSFVRETCERLGAELREVSAAVSVREFHASHGLPSDIVPVEASLEMAQFLKEKPAQLIQSNITCCSAMLWKPLADAIVADGMTTVIRGSKACDGHVGVQDGYVDDRGVRYVSPLWKWTDADVFEYLRRENISLPDHYGAVNNSFDCYLCTAFLTSAGAKERLEYTRGKYPELWPEVRDRLNAVRGVIDTQRGKIAAALEMGN